MTTTDVIPDGAMAETTEDVVDPSSKRTLRKGTRFRVEGFVSAEEAEGDRPFYWGSTSNGVNDVTVDADKARVVMTPEQVRARRPPSVAAIRKAVIAEVCGMDGFDADAQMTFDTDEALLDGEDAIEVAGQTDQGLRFAFRLRIENVCEADF